MRWELKPTPGKHGIWSLYRYDEFVGHIAADELVKLFASFQAQKESLS